jgi:hypothetical protein
VKLLRCVVVGTSLSAVLLPSSASAEDEPPPVSLFIDVDERDMRVAGKSFHKTCSEPCVMQVPAGYYTVTTPSASKEVFVDRATHVRLTRGSPTAKAVSLVLLVTGALTAVAAVAIPLYACRTPERTVDPYGQRYTSDNPCRNVSDGVKVAWIAGGGAGLTLGLVGGIGLALAGPRLTVTF